jgi:hypothetical protein
MSWEFGMTWQFGMGVSLSVVLHRCRAPEARVNPSARNDEE